jgi:hypothetical protein
MTTHHHNAASGQKPRALSPWFVHFPPELKPIDNWVLWRYLPPKSAGMKWRKVPFQPNKKAAITTDRSTWSSFDACCAAYARGGFDGLGFVFDEKIGPDGLCYCGIDFDGCIEDKKIHSLAKERLKHLKSYYEISVSGTGLHCIARAKPLDRIVKYDGVEIYSNKRFFTFTGRNLGGGFAAIKCAESEVRALVDEIRRKQAVDKASPTNAWTHEPEKTHWYDALPATQKDEVVDHALAAIAQNTCFLELEANGGNNAEYFKLTTAVARSGAPHAEDLFVKHASGAKNSDSDEALRQHFARCRDSQTPAGRPITVNTLLYAVEQNGVKFDQWKQYAQHEGTFVDPYDEFVGPPFPFEVLTPTLRQFVDALATAMGADPSATAMAALTVVAGAMHAETSVRLADGWWEKPILWTLLVGPSSSMKSPIIDKVTQPLKRIDRDRKKQWQQQHRLWLHEKEKDKKAPPPPQPVRCVINDATHEKAAELLSRASSGSLMVHDELAGWLTSFERYSSGSSRAFYLQAWNGGSFTKDRVGKGKDDVDAEIFVENLALGVLGGIQPDRLTKLGDLTADGLLQRFLPSLMPAPRLADPYAPVGVAEAEYEKLIKAINAASRMSFKLDEDVFALRDDLMQYLHKLELVDGFPDSLVSAIGKLKGYFGRLCLVLQMAENHELQEPDLPPSFTPEAAARVQQLMPLVPDNALSAGVNLSELITRKTAEHADKLIREFILPHLFGFYDVVVNGGKERGRVRELADFVISTDKDRLRPSDFTAGVRSLRGEPDIKLREWIGRLCGMGWITPEEGKPGAPTKAWHVVPGLREHFAERRKQAQAARAEAHRILKAGGSRGSRKSPDKSAGVPPLFS